MSGPGRPGTSPGTTTVWCPATWGELLSAVVRTEEQNAPQLNVHTGRNKR